MLRALLALLLPLWLVLLAASGVTALAPQTRIKGNPGELDSSLNAIQLVSAQTHRGNRSASTTIASRASPAPGGGNLAIRRQPYSGRAWRDHFEEVYGADNVLSTTVPPRGVRNLGKPLSRARSGVVYDVRGYAVFDDVAKVDLRLAKDLVGLRSRGGHFRAATRRVRDMIDGGQLSPGAFTEAQLRAIRGGRAKIPGYTWHHHQDVGRMQLVPTNIHQPSGTPHFGGFEIWYGR